MKREIYGLYVHVYMYKYVHITNFKTRLISVANYVMASQITTYTVPLLPFVCISHKHVWTPDRPHKQNALSIHTYVHVHLKSVHVLIVNLCTHEDIK